MKFLIYVLLLIAVSCTQTPRYPYALRDLPQRLQHGLQKIITDEKVPAYEIDSMSDEELLQLGKCEHPVIRAYALRLALQRKTIDGYTLLMNNLDDTALVDGGRGWRHQYVSDILLDDYVWKDTAQRAKTIDEVLLHHNYLQSAYDIVRKLGPTPKYYSAIKQMAMRPREFINSTGALYALAAYKKNEDTAYIHHLLSQLEWSFDANCFDLMADFPDTLYLTYLNTYKKMALFKSLDMWDGDYQFEKFVSCVATYKNEESFKMLKWIKENRHLSGSSQTTVIYFLKSSLYYSIINNRCLAYKPLLNTATAWEKKYPTITQEIDTPQNSLVGWLYP
jgi:hypothetical protein